MARIDAIRQDHTLPQTTERLMVQEYRGALYVRAWPRKRGRNVSDKIVRLNQRFKNAVTLSKYVDPRQIDMANKMAAKGPLYPRDYLVAAILRGFYVFVMPDGRKIYPMSSVIEISNELDAFGQNEGTILYRGDSRWDGSAPTGPYQVPLVGTFPGPVVWKTQGPELGGTHITSMIPNGIEAGNEACKGRWGQIQIRTRLQQLIPMWNAVNGAVYKVEVWEFDGNKLTNFLTDSLPVTWTFTGVARRRFLLQKNVFLEQDSIYAFLFLRTDATGTTSNQLWNMLGWGSGGWPINDFNGLVTFNTTTLSQNQAFTRKTFGNPGCIDGIMVL